MISFGVPETDFKIEIVLPRHEIPQLSFGGIIDAISIEDMIPVTDEDILGSYAVYAAFDGKGILAAFARQKKRDFLTTSVGEEVCVSELGTTITLPSHRGMGAGSALITGASKMMSTVSFIPVAVCNESSRVTFEKCGYTPVGTMPNENGHQRVVEMYKDSLFFDQSYFDEVVNILPTLPRFSNLVPAD